jgi:hypothetical protein
MHFHEMITGGLDDVAGRLEIPRCPGYVTGIMISDLKAIVSRLIDLKRSLCDQLRSEITDVRRMGNLQKIHGAAQGGSEGQTGPPGVSSLSPVDFFDF